MTAKSTPALPVAPVEYSQQYMNQLIKNLNFYLRLNQNSPPISTSGILFINYPTSSTGLPAGTVWVDTTAGNVMKVA